jgi:hypothetical protein
MRSQISLQRPKTTNLRPHSPPMALPGRRSLPPGFSTTKRSRTHSYNHGNRLYQQIYPLRSRPARPFAHLGSSLMLPNRRTSPRSRRSRFSKSFDDYYSLKTAGPAKQEAARIEVENAEDDLVQKTEVAIQLMKTVLDNVRDVFFPLSYSVRTIL